MGRSPLVPLRAAVLLAGAAMGVLLVHAFEEWNARRDLPFSAGHALFGLLLAAAAMPGPLLALFVRPASGERARGLAFGGCAVTGFVAVLGGAVVLRRLIGAGGGVVLWLTLGWCLLALPCAAVDAWRLRVGGGGSPEGVGDGDGGG